MGFFAWLLDKYKKRSFWMVLASIVFVFLVLATAGLFLIIGLIGAFVIYQRSKKSKEMRDDRPLARKINPGDKPEPIHISSLKDNPKEMIKM